MLWTAKAIVRRFFGTSLPTTSKVAGTESGSQLVISNAPTTMRSGSRLARSTVNPAAMGRAEIRRATLAPMRCAMLPPTMYPMPSRKFTRTA